MVLCDTGNGRWREPHTLSRRHTEGHMGLVRQDFFRREMAV